VALGLAVDCRDLDDMVEMANGQIIGLIQHIVAMVFGSTTLVNALNAVTRHAKPGLGKALNSSTRQLE
jgi:hypothetical protein